jgi:hypothetical protein
MAKKSAIVKGGRFTQVDGQWLVARPTETPLAMGTTIEVTVKSGKVVPFVVQGNGGSADKTIFSILAFTNEIVYFGARLDK